MDTNTSNGTESAVAAIDNAATPVTTKEQVGVLLNATIVVQCLGCAQPIVAELVNDDPANMSELPTEEVVCPTCTEKEGVRVVIPVAACAGLQVVAVEELWESSGQRAGLQADLPPAAPEPA